MLTTQIARYSRRIDAPAGAHRAAAARARRAVQADLDAKRAELARLQAELRAERARLVRLRTRLAQARAGARRSGCVELYQADTPDLVTVILNANGFADLLERGDFLQPHLRAGPADHHARRRRRRPTRPRPPQRLGRARAAPAGAHRAVLAAPQRGRRGQAGPDRHARRLRRHARRQAATRSRNVRGRAPAARGRRSRDLKAAAGEDPGARCRRRQGQLPAGPDQARQRHADLAGQRPDHLAVLRAPRLGGLPPRHRHRRPVGHADPRRRGGRVALMQSAAPSGGYGNYTCIQHTGALSTCYGHQSRVRASASASSVSQGQVIGLSRLHRPLLRPAPALRGAHQRRGDEPAELPLVDGAPQPPRVQPEIDVLGVSDQDLRVCFALASSPRARSCARRPVGARQAGRLGLRDGLRRAGRRAGRRAAVLPVQNYDQVKDDLVGEPLLRHRAGLVRRRCSAARSASAVGVAGAASSALALLDICAPALALGYAIGRIGCQVSGDGDYGKAWDGPWAMAYPNGTVPTTQTVHPTPIYETLAMGLVAWGCGALRDRVPARGPVRAATSCSRGSSASSSSSSAATTTVAVGPDGAAAREPRR